MEREKETRDEAFVRFRVSLHVLCVKSLVVASSQDVAFLTLSLEASPDNHKKIYIKKNINNGPFHPFPFRSLKI